MELICDYLRDAHQRHLLNALTQKTFGFDFEAWVTGGYFEGDYIPYSFLEDGKIVSNVSANRMMFLQNGEQKYYIQLGTVMTDPDYQRRGLAGELIRHVVTHYRDQCDGIYLFGNLDAVGFYRKLGFAEGAEYRYFVKEGSLWEGTSEDRFRPVDTADPNLRRRYLEAVRHSAPNSAFDQSNRFGLQLFYTAELENVFYSAALDCFLVMEAEEGGFVLQSILSREPLPLTEVLRRIDRPEGRCRIGFVPRPEDRALCVAERYDGGEDYRFFYLGSDLERIEREKLCFPELSHA